MQNTVIIHGERELADFPVIEMVKDDDQLTIGLPNRGSIHLLRFMDKVTIDCDPGIGYDDLCRVCQIDLLQTDYQKAISFNPDFMSKARSYENDFHVNKFVEGRAKRLAVGQGLDPNWVFGGTSGRVDQVYINLTDVFAEKVNRNTEFSLYRSDYMDDEPLAEPIFTLCASLRIKKEIAHWFLFIAWEGTNLLSYPKHIFYNNTVFSDKVLKQPRKAICV